MLFKLRDGSYAIGNALINDGTESVHTWSFVPGGVFMGDTPRSESCFHGDKDVVLWAWAPSVEEVVECLS